MIIAVASGSGGSGRTMVALELFRAAPGPVQLLDCDVETPACHLFYGGDVVADQPVQVLVPVVDEEACVACNLCADVCQSGAITAGQGPPLIFPTMCHGCGACVPVCRFQALSAEPRDVGRIEQRRANGDMLVTGRLRVGETKAAPVIRQVRQPDGRDQIIDAPSGFGSPTVAAVDGADFVVVVVDPTGFGRQDMKRLLRALRSMGLRHGAVINRTPPDREPAAAFCRQEGVAVLGAIPADVAIAQALSEGRLPSTAVPELRAVFAGIWERLRAEVPA